MNGTLREGRRNRKMRFLGDMQNALKTGLTLHRDPVGEPGGGSFAETFERKEKYIWVPFLDPEATKILSLEPYGTLGNEQGTPEFMLDYGSQRARV